MANQEARIDKWLWAARIYKTRTLAADACKNGRITINGAQTKPSRTVKVGDKVGVKKPPITYAFLVKQPSRSAWVQNSCPISWRMSPRPSSTNCWK